MEVDANDMLKCSVWLVTGELSAAVNNPSKNRLFYINQVVF